VVVRGLWLWLWGLAVLAIAGAGCSSLLAAEPTPVPGAAATLTRSIRTPIPTTVRTPAPSPGAGASPVRVAAAASPSAVAVASRGLSDVDIAQLEQRMERVVSRPDLPGVEALLLDRVAMSTSQGGQVLDNAQAAAWLREHAGSGIKVTRTERGTQTLVIQVLTEGWPNKDPIEQSRVSFSLRRYDASGRPDEDAGDWKVDVIEAE
jgi:hypothetical protein